MKAPSVSAACVAYACFFLLPTTTQAEPVFAESIEWVIATSNRVVVGKVVKVEVVPDAEGKDCQAVTVAVSETLKGTRADRAIFLLPAYVSKGYAKQWMEEGIPIIFCLVKNDGKRVSIDSNKFEWVARDDGDDVDAVLLGKSKYYWTGCIPVLTRDFKVLTEAVAIPTFIEQIVRAETTDGAMKSHTLEVPGGSTVYKKLWSGSSVFLKVPVDEQLESLGEEWCKSKSPLERAEGAKVLGYFKNEKSIGILKSLLNDPNSVESTMRRSVPGKTELELVNRKKLYVVRQAAFDSLHELGVKVDRPILEELLEGRDEPGP